VADDAGVLGAPDGLADGATDGATEGLRLGAGVGEVVQPARAAKRETDRVTVAIARFIRSLQGETGQLG
jgi:hypothetical protein